MNSNQKFRFHQVDILDLDKLKELFAKEKFRSVIHCAALKSVGESVAKPLQYYSNNIVGSLKLIKVSEGSEGPEFGSKSLNLFQCCKEFGVKEFIFSSSATVYGEPEHLPLKESSRTGLGITNPYGQTKFMVEQILTDLKKAKQVGEKGKMGKNKDKCDKGEKLRMRE